MYNDGKIRNIRAIVVKNLKFDKNITNSPSSPNTIANSFNLSPNNDMASYRSQDKRISIVAFDDDSNLSEAPAIDSCFSIHDKHQNLLYISEIIVRNGAPSFSDFMLPQLNDGRVVVKVWVKLHDSWNLLIQWCVDLCLLVMVEDIDIDELFLDNTIIIKLRDRYYTSSTNLTSGTTVKVKTSLHLSGSYNFDSIRSLNSLDKSIKELNTSKQRIARNIDEIIDNKDKLTGERLMSETLRLKLRQDELDKALKKQKSVNDKVLSDIMNCKTKINEIRQSNDEVPQTQKDGKNELELIESQTMAYEEGLDLMYNTIKGYFRDYGAVLADIMPIDKTDPLYNLSIMGLECPSSIDEILKVLYSPEDFNLRSVHELSSEHSRISQINTVIGYIVQLISCLVCVTNVPVYYTISHEEDHYTISDFKGNIYPLVYDPHNTIKVNDQIKNEVFETGIRLLNKNLLLVLHHVNTLYKTFDHTTSQPLLNNIPIDCLDNFLWNLQYLLLFMTAE